jgi:hypothetical protein
MDLQIDNLVDWDVLIYSIVTKEKFIIESEWDTVHFGVDEDGVTFTYYTNDIRISLPAQTCLFAFRQARLHMDGGMADV